MIKNGSCIFYTRLLNIKTAHWTYTTHCLLYFLSPVTGVDASVYHFSGHVVSRMDQ